jgi:hypothetical protein
MSNFNYFCKVLIHLSTNLVNLFLEIDPGLFIMSGILNTALFPDSIHHAHQFHTVVQAP